MTALRNPGIIIPAKEKNNSTFSCPKCNATRMKGSFHCNDCNVCIKEWDHHCLWTGKCIGEGNMSFFWGFLACTLLFLSYHMATALGVYKDL